MPIEAAKAFWQVTAGLHQEHIIPEYSRQWGYTSSEYEKDCQTPESEPTIFQKRDIEVHEYARSITDPRRVNYVKLEFLWV